METVNKQTVHFTDAYLMAPTHPITVAVVGCGGTGSLILVRLARLDQALRQLDHPGLQVTAIDGDIVEAHNVGRQNFTFNDVGKYKASCIIEKINFAFGLAWDAQNVYCGDAVPNANILITAVDTAAFRMHVDKTIKTDRQPGVNYTRKLYWLDTGNGKDFGQVVLSTWNAIKQPEKSQFATVAVLPSIADIFGDLTLHDDQDTQGMESCSFYESIAKQDLFINDAVAVQAVNLLWRLLRDLYISYHGVVINQATLQQRGIMIK